MRNTKILLKGQNGQILVYVIVIMVVAVLVITPLVGLTYSGLRASSISYEKMQRLYAADAGVEDALEWLIGNGTVTKSVTLPDDNNPDVNYILPNIINGCTVQVDVYWEGNTTHGYLITTTATDNINKKRAKVQVHTFAGTGPSTKDILVPGNGTPGTSGFQYAVASLGPETVRLKTNSGNNPSILAGDIYSGGDLVIDPDFTLALNDGRASNAYAKGSITVGDGSLITGCAEADGDLHLGAGAIVQQDAYAGGNIILDAGARIGGSAYAGGGIIMFNSAKSIGVTRIGVDAVANGTITMTSLGFLTEIGGNASSNQDIYVGQVGGGSIPSAVVDGNAAAHNTVYTYPNGLVKGTTTSSAPLFNLVPPQLPQLVNPDVVYWQKVYYCQAHGYVVPQNPTPPTLPCSCNLTHPCGNGSYAEYPAGLTVKNNKNVNLGPTHIYGGDLNVSGSITIIGNATIYVDGNVNLGPGSNVKGGGKIIATGTIFISNHNIGDPNDFVLLESLSTTVPAIQVKNNDDFYGVLYAPYSETSIWNMPNLQGSIVGQFIYNQGGGNQLDISWDSQVVNIPGLPGGNITIPGGGWVPGTVPTITFTGANIDWYHVLEQ
jgi:Tfp pilus assembly protein PilX